MAFLDHSKARKMYYNSEEIDEDLKCSVCKQKFSGDVRLVPDCGESICDGCYEELMDSVDEAGLYKCQACRNEHTMSKKGLPAIKSLSKIVKRRRVEKSLSDEARALKSLVESFDEKIRALVEFDERYYINCHCDELELQVMEQIESLVKELSEIEKDLLKQISEYRKSCLDAWSERRTSTHQETLFNKETQEMRKKAAEFSFQWADYFYRIDAVATDKRVGKALAKAKLFERNLNIAHKQLRSKALNGHTMTFMAHDWLIGEQSPLKRAVKLMLPDDRITEFSIGSTPTHQPYGHTGRIRQILFLENGNLASCGEDESIRIWDTATGDMLFMLELTETDAKSLALLWNGWLASSSFESEIQIWDLAAKRVIRTLDNDSDDDSDNDTSTVGQLMTLKNGNLISYTPNIITIWDPYLTENNLLLTITGHEGVDWVKPGTFGLLSNDNIVTLTCPVDETSHEKTEKTIKVWNSNDGQLVKSVSFKFGKPTALLVLANDQVALGSDGGIIKVFALDGQAASSKTTMKVASGEFHAFAQLPNENLISFASNYDDADRFSILAICVWDPKRGRLLQTINTGHYDDVYTLAISPDTMTLATGSFDGAIKLWPIN